MASTVNCSIVSAEEEIFSGQVEMVVATGTIGELGILPGHTPLLSGVKPGPVRLILEGGEEQIYFASGGFIEVQPTSITILADTALRADDLDEAAALESQRRAEQELADQKSDVDFARVSSDLQEQAAMLRTIRKFRERKK
ncbi:MAG: F0F1 ATP synthase subunit epsilon [Gammaproteobacteria bacterium]|jgi:F-type H+-transporting ATPase subunit epsilon|nr:F0F1 ATP synthase subunit epsilon [Gammaproteobacteria bacterium]|tara:strand:- start:122 stop:544 length:423 start_codon:yes stop_codon:yes gene_type:complete